MSDRLTLHETISTIFSDIQNGTEEEITSIRSQISQIESLVIDAIGSLHESFEAVSGDTQEQMTLMSALMADIIDYGPDAKMELNIFQKAEESSEVLKDLIETLMTSSKNNLRALTKMDAMREQMNQMMVSAAKSEDAINAIAILAEEDSIDVEKLKTLTKKASDAQNLHVKQANKATALYKEMHDLVDDIASADMDEVYASKGKVEEILNHLYQINDLISNCRTEVTMVNGRIRQSLGVAIRSLQFEDIVSQSLGHTTLHLDRMEGFVLHLSQGLAAIEVVEGMSLDDYEAQVAAIHAEMLSYRDKLRLEDKNPVSQESMDEGDIDLF
ncbi:MAG: hypothetical protein R8K22_06350 [Mariprofundaceae bacterium]